MKISSLNRWFLLFNTIIVCWNIANLNFTHVYNINLISNKASREVSTRRERRNSLIAYNKAEITTTGLSDSELKKQFVQECKDATNKPLSEKKECEMVSSHPIKHVLARFIIFQRNEGYKIHDLISHYSNVVPLDSIVVIDHQGTDSLTASILDNFAEQGMHLWRCNQDYTLKNEMWTNVGRKYSPHSDFIFFLDSDEYMTILHEDELHWNPSYFIRELVNLPKTNQPFKTIRSIPVPIDCPGSQNIHAGEGSSSSLCRLQYTESDTGHYCYNKLFFRGKSFKQTDTGNHHPNDSFRTKCCQAYHQKNEREGSLPIPRRNFMYSLTNFTLLHTQSLEFSDFLIHLFRGAATRGYNKEGVKCTPRMVGVHHCEGFQELRDVEFDLNKMRDIYEQKRCKCYEESPDSKLYSVKNVFSALCQN